MMKFLLSFLLVSSPLFAAVGEQDEIALLQELISTTQKNLYSQQMLLKLIVEFKQARHSFVAEPTNGKLASSLVKCAMRLQSHLDQEHLSHLFSSDFLMELAFFNQVGTQQITSRE